MYKTETRYVVRVDGQDFEKSLPEARLMQGIIALNTDNKPPEKLQHVQLIEYVTYYLTDSEDNDHVLNSMERLLITNI